MMKVLRKFIKIINKKLITKWDPEYTRVTFKEKVLLKKSDIEMSRGKYVAENKIWKEN